MRSCVRSSSVSDTARLRTMLREPKHKPLGPCSKPIGRFVRRTTRAILSNRTAPCKLRKTTITRIRGDSMHAKASVAGRQHVGTWHSGAPDQTALALHMRRNPLGFGLTQPAGSSAIREPSASRTHRIIGGPEKMARAHSLRTDFRLRGLVEFSWHEPSVTLSSPRHDRGGRDMIGPLRRTATAARSVPPLRGRRATELAHAAL